MALTLPAARYVPKYGSIVRFAPVGATIESVTVARNTKPAGSVFTDWESLGCVETAELRVLKEPGQEVNCFNATTGLWEKMRTGDTDADTRLQLDLVLQEVSDYTLQLAFAAATVNGTTGAYEPASMAGGAVQGWLLIQTQIGTEVVSVLNLFVEMTLSEPAMIANRTQGWKPKLQITQLGSASEAGVLGVVS